MMEGAGVGMEKDEKGGGAKGRLSSETKSHAYGHASPGYARGVCDAVRRNTLGFVKNWLVSFIFSLGDARVDAKSRRAQNLSKPWMAQQKHQLCMYIPYVLAKYMGVQQIHFLDLLEAGGDHDLFP